MKILQNSPRFLEWTYLTVNRLLYPIRHWLKPGGKIERVFIGVEKVHKSVLFGCKMCGQCILHDTGMTCPMTCPKNLRNGPCGGVQTNGHCEVVPNMKCVWVQAWERSKKMTHYGSGILNVQAPLDRRLEGSSAWINKLSEITNKDPVGWEK